MPKIKSLPLTYFGNPILRRKARKVKISEIKKAGFQRLIKQMVLTTRKESGVGLAAPQIGRSIQLAVIEIKKTKIRPQITPLKLTVIINPQIIHYSRVRIHDWEGCLSFPAVRGLVPRNKLIKVKYLNELGKKQTLDLKDFQARVFQHEIDHLNGILFIDRVKDVRTLMTLGEFEQRILRKGLKSK
ncbi:MAG: peptide deformylase [Candidatus Colwellbacteria bacterium]|nr:peptide deformylase [Candidatus Colwellbacteria bacterium]